MCRQDFRAQIYDKRMQALAKNDNISLAHHILELQSRQFVISKL